MGRVLQAGGASHEQAYRLAAGGRLIDRNQPLAFTFDGKPLSGYAGDTLASAVLANGQRLIGRSFKYHRPRGVVGLGAEEMNALIGVGDGAAPRAQSAATQVELDDGLVAVSQNRWPSLSFDIGADQQRVLALHSGRLLLQDLHVAEELLEASSTNRCIRRAAGLGKAPDGRDPDTYEQIHVHCDVLVVGGGPSGLAAAEAAAATGARVMLVDENPIGGCRPRRASPISMTGGAVHRAPPGMSWS